MTPGVYLQIHSRTTVHTVEAGASSLAVQICYMTSMVYLQCHSRSAMRTEEARTTNQSDTNAKRKSKDHETVWQQRVPWKQGPWNSLTSTQTVKQGT